MLFQTPDAITAFLKRYDGFAECLLVRFQTCNYGAAIECFINYVWDENGHIRHNLIEDEPNMLFRFHSVQRLNLIGDLNGSMTAVPECLDWGLTEFAMLRLQKPVSTSQPLLRMVFSWEGARRLDIEFLKLEVERLGTGHENSGGRKGDAAL